MKKLSILSVTLLLCTASYAAQAIYTESLTYFTEDPFFCTYDGGINAMRINPAFVSDHTYFKTIGLGVVRTRNYNTDQTGTSAFARYCTPVAENLYVGAGLYGADESFLKNEFLNGLALGLNYRNTFGIGINVKNMLNSHTDLDIGGFYRQGGALSGDRYHFGNSLGIMAKNVLQHTVDNEALFVTALHGISISDEFIIRTCRWMRHRISTGYIYNTMSTSIRPGYGIDPATNKYTGSAFQFGVGFEFFSLFDIGITKPIYLKSDEYTDVSGVSGTFSFQYDLRRISRFKHKPYNLFISIDIDERAYAFSATAAYEPGGTGR